MRIAVVTDSGSNYREEGYDVKDIFCVPLTITDDDTTYLMGETLTVEECYKMVAEGKILKTSMPPVGRIEQLFTEIKEMGYDAIFGVPICSGLSGCISAMCTTAERVGIRFEYIDCYSTASNQLYLTLTARKMLDMGMDIMEVKEKLQKAAEDSVTFVLPVDLMHLAKGGRLTKRTAILAGLLKISPITIVNKESGGTNDIYDKPRTLRRAEEKVIQYFKDHNVGKNYRICVAHVSDIEEGTNFYNMMKENFPEAEIYLTDLVAAVGCHTGVKTVACQYIKKLEENL